MLAAREVPSVLLPLGVGAATILFTVIIHALFLSTIIRFVRREQRLGRAGVSFWKDLTITASAVLVAFAAHLLEIALWALVLVLSHEFVSFALAFYCSAQNYTTLGSGDVVISDAWKLLGPLEAADGMLMFGVSTAMIFAVIQRLVQTRLAESETAAGAPEGRPQKQPRSM